MRMLFHMSSFIVMIVALLIFAGGIYSIIDASGEWRNLQILGGLVSMALSSLFIMTASYMAVNLRD